MKKEKQKKVKPRAKGEVTPKRPMAAKIKDIKSKVLRVLILEDNPVDTELMERQLKKDGITFISRRVDSKSNYLKALKTFQPDLILADYKLPKFDALQALALRSKMAPQTPFIIVTGTISEATAVECMKHGADDYLLKDRLARLGEAVRHALTIHRLRSEKIAAEESLRSNELLYRTFIDSSSDMAFLKDDKFRHLLSNRELCRFYNKTEKEILGKVDAELMGKSAAAKCRKTDRQALAENRVHVSEETIDGRTFETHKFPVKLINGRVGVGGYIRDISERKQQLGMIEQSSKKWFTTFDTIKDGIALLAVDQTVMQANRAFADLVNKPFKEIIGKKCYELVHDDRSPHPQCPFRRMLKSKKRESMELAIADRTFEILADPIINDAGAITGAVHIMSDITERKRIVQALQESEDKFKHVFEAANVGKSITLPTGEIYVNQAFCDMIGYKQKELQYKKWQELTPADEIEIIQKKLEPLLKGLTDSARFNKRYIHKNGSHIWVDVSTAMRREQTGKPLHFITTIIDITERKQAEEQIRASLLEKEILLKEIHHRVKNNLQVISGLLTLQAAQIDDERFQRMIKESQGRIWTMALIHQTLYQTGNLADIDMADYIRSLSGNLLSSHAQIAMPPTIIFNLLPLRLTIDKAIPLALIINELLTNAIKHAFPDGRPGEIRITLQERRGTACRAPNEETNGQYEKGTARRAPTYEMTVADDGIGLPAGFDPKTQKSLGLQLVVMLVNQLGGQLAIESKGGTIVGILFNGNEKNEKQS